MEAEESKTMDFVFFWTVFNASVVFRQFNTKLSDSEFSNYRSDRVFSFRGKYFHTGLMLRMVFKEFEHQNLGMEA